MIRKIRTIAMSPKTIGKRVLKNEVKQIISTGSNQNLHQVRTLIGKIAEENMLKVRDKTNQPKRRRSSTTLLKILTTL